jgi:hypothetical protein
LDKNKERKKEMAKKGKSKRDKKEIKIWLEISIKKSKRIEGKGKNAQEIEERSIQKIIPKIHTRLYGHIYIYIYIYENSI